MMWEEKIDKLKRELSSNEFHVPFTDGMTILKKIESKFVINQDGTYHHTNWAERIKGRVFIKSMNKNALLSIVKTLDKLQSYWFVIVMGNAPTSKQYVYGCSLNALPFLISLATNDFFIVDKKLEWLTYFHPAANRIDIYKSGKVKTPFDSESPN